MKFEFIMNNLVDTRITTGAKLNGNELRNFEDHFNNLSIGFLKCLFKIPLTTYDDV